MTDTISFSSLRIDHELFQSARRELFSDESADPEEVIETLIESHPTIPATDEGGEVTAEYDPQESYDLSNTA